MSGYAAKRVYKTASFQAAAYGRYHTAGSVSADGSVVVTDPASPNPGDIFDLVIVSGFVRLGDGVDYTASRFPIEREYNGATWSTLPANLLGSPALTQGIGDARYSGQGAAGTIYESMLAADTAYVVGTTTPQNTALTLSLPVGTYHFRLSLSSKGPDFAAGGVKAQLAVSGSFTWSVSYQMAGTQAVTTMGGSGSVGAICNGSYPGSLTSTILNSAGVNGWTCVEGRLVVTAPVVITAQIAQYAASGSTGVCIQAGAYLQAIKQ